MEKPLTWHVWLCGILRDLVDGRQRCLNEVFKWRFSLIRNHWILQNNYDSQLLVMATHPHDMSVVILRWAARPEQCHNTSLSLGAVSHMSVTIGLHLINNQLAAIRAAWWYRTRLISMWYHAGLTAPFPGWYQNTHRPKCNELLRDNIAGNMLWAIPVTSFSKFRYVLVRQIFALASGNVFKKLKHCSIVIDCWDIHWSVHLLFQVINFERPEKSFTW